EEGVKAAVHGELDAVGLFGPPADPPAQVVLAFDDVDGDAAFGETGRGGQARDAGADDDDARWRRQYPGAAQAVRCRECAAAAVGHDGALTRKVCAMLVSQPGMVSLCTPTKPTSRSRRRKRWAPSN